MKQTQNTMKIQVNKVEGNTERKGTKQNKLYTITNQCLKETILPNGKIADLSSFYTAIDEKGKTYELWNVHKDWSCLGIRKIGQGRYSYTSNFIVNK